MRVLVCGGRDFDDRDFLRRSLDWLPVGVLIEGCARGADALAEEYAREMGIPNEHYPADWKRDGKAAGPIRNTRMLDEGQPNIIVAFPGGTGTADMVRQARKRSLSVFEMKP